MALPAGVATRIITFGGVSDAVGDVEDFTVTFTPTQTLVWAATGDVITDDPIATTTTGGAGSIALPRTDVTGFIDQSGQPVTSWAYRVDFSGPGAGGRRSAWYALPGGFGALDLDLMVPLRYV